MADNQIKIDLLINAAESAKTLKEQRTALKELQSALGQLEEGSSSFNKVAAAAGSLKDGIADLRAQTNFYADDLRTLSGLSDVGEGIAASFGIVTASLEAMGIGSENAQEAIKKLEIAQTALNSINAIGNLIQKESAGNILLTNALKKVGIDLTVAEGVATEGLTIKQRILNVVQKASPMGILVGLATALFGAYAILTRKTDEEVEAEKKSEAQKKKLIAVEKERQAQIKAAGEYVGKEASGYAILAEQLLRTEPRSKARLDLITKINATYGTTLKNLGDEKKFQDQVTGSLEKYINFLKTKYALQANEKLIQDNIKKQYALEKELAKEQASLNESIEARKRSGYKDTGRDLRIALELQYEVVDGLKADLDAADKRLKGYVTSATNLSEKIAATGLKTADTSDKTNKKITTTTEKTFKTLLELQQKYASDLEQAQLDLQNTLLTNNETYYSEILSSEESYNTQYLAQYKTEQDALLAVQTTKLEDQKKAELISVQSKIDEVLKQYKLGTTEYSKEYESGQKIKEDIGNVYKAKEKELIENSNKTKLEKEKEINSKLIQIRTAARQAEIEELQTNLDLAESNLITYNQKISILLRKIPFEYKFPEATSPIIVENITGNVEALTKIQKELNDETTVYGKELNEIYLRQRKGIADVVKASITQNEEQKKLGIYDVNRNELNIKLNEVNKKQAEELFELVKKVQKEKQLGIGATQEEIDKANELGDAEYANMLKALEFVNKRVIIEEKVSALLKGQVGDRNDLLLALRDTKQISQEEYQLSIESVDTIKEYYRLLVQQNVVSSIYGESLKQHMKSEKLGIEYAKEKGELLFGQTVEIQTQNEEVSKFLNEQSQSSEKINEILQKRKTTLEEINKIQDPYEKEAQKIQLYLQSSNEISDILQQDGKRFEDFSRGVIEQFTGIDSASTVYKKALLSLSGEITYALNKEKLQNENNVKTFNDQLKNKEITQEEYNKNIEDEEKRHQNALNTITEAGALKQVQIEDDLNKQRVANRMAIFNESLKLIEEISNAIFATIAANDQARLDNQIAISEKRKDMELAEYDRVTNLQEMAYNNATIQDYQELQRKQEIQQQKEQIELQAQMRESELRKKAWKKQQDMAVAQATIDGILAVAKALTSAPWPISLISAAGAAISAGIQVAAIKSQPMPQFAKGGLLDGPSHASGGIKTPFGELEGGEAVINKKSTKMFAPMLSAINQVGGGVKFAGGGITPSQVVPQDTNSLTRIENMLMNYGNKPILTYVNESEVTRAQRNQQKIDRRTTF